MIRTTINATAIGCPNSQTTAVKFIATAIAKFGGFINNLVKRRKDIIGELNLGYGYRTLSRQAYSKTHYALLGQRRIKAACPTVFFL